jgi:hypothetical protein
MVSGVVGELCVLFKNGDYEGVVSRAEQLQHRHRGSRDGADRPLLSAARAAALVHLGRPELAAPVVKELLATEADHPAHPAVSTFASYAQPYIAWATNQGVAPALEALRERTAPGDAKTRALEAQLLYRLGRYDEAAAVYRAMYDAAKAVCEAASGPPAAPRPWSLTGRRDAATQQSALSSRANLETVRQTRNEVATNLMAALVLAGSPAEALALKADLGELYEVEYNGGCAAIGAKDWAGAKVHMEEAERLFRTVMESEEDDTVGLAPILVQRAYVGHVTGDVAGAEQQYTNIVRERSADPASLAVAANNAAVATGQLALGKQQMLVRQHALHDGRPAAASSDDAKEAERNRNAVLFDALKKMKATSGWDVDRKLTFQQRRAMARNRAVLLVQMGRLDACRVELDKLKAAFPDDALVPLIEAALVARKKSPADADKLLAECSDRNTNVVRAARVRLAIEGGDAEAAVKLLEQLFPGRAAALATAASVLENDGKLDEAMLLLRRVPSEHPKLAMEAKRALAGTLLRACKYEEAARVLTDVLTSAPYDELILGQLVVATSYFDAGEAERLAERLPALNSGGEQLDVEALEARPPPRKRDIARTAKSAETSAVGGAGSAERVALDSAKAAEAKTERKKKAKKKQRLPKNYDPDGPPPDPERWLPKTLRSSYKKKKKNREMHFRGAQGADAAAADAAGARNAERSAARVAETATAASSAQVPKGTKAKGSKKNRRR